MKIIDVHSHWGTKRGYPLQTPAEQEQQKATWNSQVNYHSEAEMAQYFRDSGVQTILDFGFSKFLPMEETRALHDYAFETEAAHRDVILGHWIHIDPPFRRGGLARAAPLHRQAHRLSRLWRLGIAEPAGQRSACMIPSTSFASKPRSPC